MTRILGGRNRITLLGEQGGAMQERANGPSSGAESIFADVVREQLDEQRSLTGLVGRVETLLGAVSDEIDGLGAVVADSARPVEEALSRTRAELSEALRRLERRTETSDGQIAEQLAALSGRLQDLEEALVGAADAGGLNGGAERVEALRRELENRLAAQRVEGAQGLGEARRALHDQASQLEALRGALAAEVEAATARIEHVLGALTHEQRGALSAIGEATHAASRAATDAHEVVASAASETTTRLGEAAEATIASINDTLADVRGAAERIGLRLAEDVRGAVREASAPIEQAAADLQASTEALRTAGQSQVAGLRRTMDDALAALSDSARMLPAMADQVAEAASAELRTAIGAVHADLDELAESVRAALTDQLAEHREALRASAAELEGGAQRAGEVIRTDTARLRDEMERVQGALTQAVERVHTAMADRLDLTEAAVADHAATVRRAVEEVAPHLSGAADEAISRFGATLGETLDDALGTRIERLEQLASSGQTRLEQLATSMLERVTAATEQFEARLDTVRDREERAADQRAERLAGVAERLEASVERAAEVTVHLADVAQRNEAAVSEARAGVRDDAEAAMSDLQIRAEAVMESMTGQALTELRRVAQRLDGEIARVETLDVGSLIAQLRRSLEAAAEREAAFERRLGEALAAMEQLTEQVLAGSQPAEHARDGFAVPPEPSDEVLARRCPTCGFVAKTPAGLSAHKRTHR